MTTDSATAAEQAPVSATNPPSAGRPKTEKELAKEAEKQAKLEKFRKKQELQKAKAAAKAASGCDTAKKEKKNKQVITYDKPTPVGEKKDTSDPLPDQYSPRFVEAAWDAWWEKSGFFKPEYKLEHADESKDPYVTVIPPPNVTGTLHLGHALASAIEDVLARWNRMSGRRTLWVPGCDHAGIATQVVVEKIVWRDKKLTRHDLGREGFIKEVWAYKEAKGDRIYEQFRKLGISADWDRVTFTMEPKAVYAVIEAFIRMHEKGLIYRSYRLVNWSCKLKSAISDIEVDSVQLDGPTMMSVPDYDEMIEFGVYFHFDYQIENSDEKIRVATTRIETMLGDTAVAVHPEDPKYKHLHGKFIKHPFVNRRIPIILDPHADPTKGTGAVKITPAHDQNDYEVGMRHKLPFVNILDDDGCIVDGYGEFSGMKRFHARKAVIEALDKLGLYAGKVENKGMVVPVCNRSKDVVEPRLKVQWFANCKEMASRAVKAVRDGDLKFYPSRFNVIWYNWLENIHDWCISRQLWWGHRIPAYLVSSTDADSPINSLPDNDRWVSAHDESSARQKAADKFKQPIEKLLLKQDEDVLDTWFSSGLFPFMVMGWPNQTPDMKNYYPNALLETGADIIFFWVARMVMMGLELTNMLPFHTVVFHPMVRDAHGRKMSKSLGNVIDPLDVIYGISLEDLHQTLYKSNLDPKEIDRAKAGQKSDFPNGIPECGTDALRFGLLAYCTQGRDINLDINRIEGYRFFCNKLWNAFKFCQLKLGADFAPLPEEKLTGDESLMDLWILSRLAATIADVNSGFEQYEFHQITNPCYQFWLHELCDVYLEHIKRILDTGSDKEKNSVRQTLFTCIHNGLRLLHPMMPFITEELYQRLPKRASEVNIPSIVVHRYPRQHAFIRDEKIEKCIQFVLNLIRQVRSLRSEYNLTNKQRLDAYIRCHDPESTDAVKALLDTIAALTSSNSMQLLAAGEKAPAGYAVLPVTSTCELFLNLKGVIDVQKEIERLNSKLTQNQEAIGKLQAQMADEHYVVRVPEAVRASNTDKLTQLKGALEKVEQAIACLSL